MVFDSHVLVNMLYPVLNEGMKLYMDIHGMIRIHEPTYLLLFEPAR